MIDELSFYKYRDSLSGLGNEEYAAKEFKRLSGKENFGAVMIRLEECENMPFYKAERYIRQAGDLLTNIVKGSAARIKSGDFILFCEMCEEEAERIDFFLTRVSEDMKFTVGSKCFDSETKDYFTFLRDMDRILYLVKVEKLEKGIY